MSLDGLGGDINIKPSARASSNLWGALFLNVSGGVLFFGGLLLAGAVALWVTQFIVLLPGILRLGSKIVWLTLAMVYFSGLLIFFLTNLFLEPLRELLKTLNHLIVRLISVWVVGVADVFGGRAWVAVVCYLSLITLFVFLSFYFLVNFVFAYGAGEVVKELISGAHKGPPTIAQALRVSFYFSVEALLVVLPIAMMGLRSWKIMVRRPDLTVFDSSAKLGRAAAHFSLAHLSDLHAKDRSLERTNENIRALVLNLTARVDLDCIAVTGDITDNGSCVAWNEFLDAVGNSPLRRKLILVPGNHDLNVVHEGLLRSFFTIESPTKVDANIRSLNFLRVLNVVVGDRAKIVCPYSGGVVAYEDFYKHAEWDLDSWERKDLRPSAMSPLELFEAVFPMLISQSSNDGRGCNFLVWNTVKTNRWAVLNAVGEIGRGQLLRAQKLLESCKALPVFHLMHHQLGVPRQNAMAYNPSVKWWARPFIVGMGLQNPWDMIEFICRRAQRTAILHGHHHKYFWVTERFSRAHVVSCPSSTCEVEATYSDAVPIGWPGRWLKISARLDGPHLDIVKIEVNRCD